MPGDTAPSEEARAAHRRILGFRVDALTPATASATVLRWAAAGDSRYVCFATVNNVMVGRRDAAFRRLHNDADLVTPDGMPMVWGLRLQGLRGTEQVCGPEIMPRVCGEAAAAGIPVGLFGGHPEVLHTLRTELPRRFPGLEVAYAHSPPFRTPTEAEEAQVVEEIRASGARILFVGLGCPKQERWMARHRGSIPAVMLGVGAAFDFEAGHKAVAPRWVRRIGLEWLFRLLSEPRRLWRRYVLQNPVFVVLFAAQLLRARIGATRAAR